MFCIVYLLCFVLIFFHVLFWYFHVLFRYFRVLLSYLHMFCVDHRQSYGYEFSISSNNEFVSKRYDCLWFRYFPMYFFFFIDICSAANSTPLHENYYRSKNCIYNSTTNLCDRHLDQKWYRSNVDILTSCPESLECGTPFPLWLNGKRFIMSKW